MGRFTELTDEISAEIIEAIGDVLTLNQASALCSRPQPTADKWLEKGRADFNNDEDTVHARFAVGIKRAQALKVKEYLNNIAGRLPGWQANAWLLERCFRSDFSVHGDLETKIGMQIDELKRELVRLTNPEHVDKTVDADEE